LRKLRKIRRGGKKNKNVYKKDNIEDESKKKIKTVTKVDEEGFITQKKMIFSKDEKGNEVQTEINILDEFEIEETKTTNKGILMNNMYEMTKLEGSFEPIHIEQSKQKIRKGQATVNNREIQKDQALKQNKQISHPPKQQTKKKPPPPIIINNPPKNNTPKNNNPKKNNNDKTNETNKNNDNQNKDTNKNQKPQVQNQPKKNNNIEKKPQPKPDNTKNVKKQNPKNTETKQKRPQYVPTEVSKKNLQKLQSLTKKKAKNWYEHEYIQPTVIVIICLILILTIYSFILSQ